MKQLLFFIVLIVLLGVGSFLYRNVLEQPFAGTNSTNTACTLEAKMCPDGSSVGRSGPTCAFAACAAPNVELSQIGISFVLPRGFALNTSPVMPGDTLVAAYEKSMMTDPKDAIVIRRLALVGTETANDVMLKETMYESSGNQPKTMEEFKPLIINGKTFQTIVVERFEGQVHSLYYLPRDHDVLRFEVLEHNVTNWTDPKLDITTLPDHAALITMLGTLQAN
ncbi:MAG: hypothetical protein JWN90_214 [Parcubacteria group bacterium]|nr:hypothetical protein [Parcubacteria group bacterium]